MYIYPALVKNQITHRIKAKFRREQKFFEARGKKTILVSEQGRAGRRFFGMGRGEDQKILPISTFGNRL